MNKIVIDNTYYYDIKKIACLAIKKYGTADIFSNPYAEAASILKAVKHRSELIYSPNLEEIKLCINEGELWALKMAVDDLLSESYSEISSKKLKELQDYFQTLR